MCIEIEITKHLKESAEVEELETQFAVSSSRQLSSINSYMHYLCLSICLHYIICVYGKLAYVYHGFFYIEQRGRGIFPLPLTAAFPPQMCMYCIHVSVNLVTIG